MQILVSPKIEWSTESPTYLFTSNHFLQCLSVDSLDELLKLLAFLFESLVIVIVIVERLRLRTRRKMEQDRSSFEIKSIFSYRFQSFLDQRPLLPQRFKLLLLFATVFLNRFV